MGVGAGRTVDLRPEGASAFHVRVRGMNYLFPCCGVPGHAGCPRWVPAVGAGVPFTRATAPATSPALGTQWATSPTGGAPPSRRHGPSGGAGPHPLDVASGTHRARERIVLGQHG